MDKAHMIDVGLDEAFVTGILSMGSLILTCGKFLTGACYDRFGLPLETVMLSLITNDMFGDASFNKVLGIVTAVNYAGFALCSPPGQPVLRHL